MIFKRCFLKTDFEKLNGFTSVVQTIKKRYDFRIGNQAFFIDI